MGAPSFKVRPLKFLQEIHLEDSSCHTFRTQSADQAPIIITDVCPNPKEDLFLFYRRKPHHLTIAQVTARYCKRFWKANVREVVYGRAPQPPTGEVE